MKIRKCFYFSGDVQGVGFRFRAYHTANALGLTGWVRNEYDGSVTLEVQGEESGVDVMPDIIEKSPYIRIENVEAKTLPIDPEEKSFEIRD